MAKLSVKDFIIDCNPAERGHGMASVPLITIKQDNLIKNLGLKLKLFFVFKAILQKLLAEVGFPSNLKMAKENSIFRQLLSKYFTEPFLKHRPKVVYPNCLQFAVA